MPQSLHFLNSHLVFSTKGREPWITANIRPQVWAYLAGILKRMECKSVTVGGVADHVHIVCNLTKKMAPMKVLEELKRDSSKFVKTLDPKLRDFSWQGGYAIFSLSPSHFAAAADYALNQEEYHKHETFQEELLRLLKKYGAEYDERYLWD